MYTNIEISQIIILFVQTNVLKNTTTSNQKSNQKTCNLPFVAFSHLYNLFVAFIQRFPSIHK